MAEPTLQVVDTTHFLLLIGGGLVVVLSIFGILAVIISMLNYEVNPVKDRLAQLKEDGSFELGLQVKAGPFDDLKDILGKMAEPVSKSLYGQNKKYVKQVKSLLTEAGLNDSEEQIFRFMTHRASVGIAVGCIGAVAGLVFGSGSFLWLLSGFLGGFMFGSLIPQFMLRSNAAKRKAEIRFKLPDTLDLMVVCVEAGLGLDSTIQRVAEETEKMSPEVSYEFKRLNKELNAGISRIEAFQSMGLRSGVDEMRSLCAMIVQADKMGTSVATTLRIYADDLRTKRRQRAEELASKASIKMTFPLVLFIFPPLFIILMGPVVINAIIQFYPAK
ncbi:type II secretion system F family protein [Vampirovibrio sp.]|uniref:type II secretion system F family protein n=1 Tax=Vampirovibrio sp. TaxID=2717857 RepID=UPI003593D5FD